MSRCCSGYNGPCADAGTHRLWRRKRDGRARRGLRLAKTLEVGDIAAASAMSKRYPGIGGLARFPVGRSPVCKKVIAACFAMCGSPAIFGEERWRGTLELCAVAVTAFARHLDKVPAARDKVVAPCGRLSRSDRRYAEHGKGGRNQNKTHVSSLAARNCGQAFWSPEDYEQRSLQPFNGTNSPVRSDGARKTESRIRH